jgi:hypothetical protein|tara:strand:- start:243 stop:959 length:717 start_codon:yes stop_codon:yes gene_type:complete
MDKPSYYAILTADVRYDRNLKPLARLLFAEITALCNKEGYCWASNQYFAELYQVDKTTVSGWIGQLKARGYLTVQLQYKKGSKQILNRYIKINGEGIDEITKTSFQKDVDPIDQKTKVNTKTNTKTNITVNNVDDFDSFWKFYPRKASKDAARKAWIKLRPDVHVMQMIADNVKERVEKGEWRKDNQSFILHASTYLNQKRWEDEVVDQQTQTQTRTNPDSMKSISVMEKITDRSWAE